MVILANSVIIIRMTTEIMTVIAHVRHNIKNSVISFAMRVNVLY